MKSKKKKKTQEPEPVEKEKEKDVREQEYTDRGTVYDDEDPEQLYPPVREDKGISTGKEGNRKEKL